MDRIETYEAAVVLVADAARDITLTEIMKRHPDPVDARAIQEAILISGVRLERRGTWLPGLNRTVRVATVIGFPLIVPVLAVLHIARIYNGIVRRAFAHLKGI